MGRVGSDLGTSPWDSQHGEFDYVVRDVQGRIPEALRGVLYRIGPGRFEVGGHPIGHIFDGDGMVSRFEIAPSAVRFRNRYVRTRTFERSSRDGKPSRGFGTQRLGGALANALRFPENMANTNVLTHGESLYALWEGGRPHRMDAETLATYGAESFGGALKRLGAFSAHPKVDPTTGDVFNFGLDFFPRPMIRCYRLSPGGQLSGLATIPIPKLGFVHDFALTERFLAFVLGPLVVKRPIPVALGLRPFDDALSYQPDLGTTIVLVPRDGSAAIRIEDGPLFHFHVTNAYDLGSETVVELVAHDPGDGGWAKWNSHLRDYRGEPGPAFGGTLTRLVVNRDTRRCSSEPLSDLGGEFPQLDHRRTTTPHRFTYLAQASRPGGNPDLITTIDHTLGTHRSFLTDGDDTICEPLFVADPGTSEEGAGWLLTVRHRPTAQVSALLILRADRPDDGPLATATLDHHIPMTFHGAFAPST
ncbi:carotenoid oxygenase family protein [Gordonia sp. (in: high G+C Gram-positive bacteria)]|uniref:carotenoid oxygenase family protein n=1 Tax=Gordonia sp. (in: high G+C Gram-positive bacteria) TaxID=84139 RepID=UPI0016A4E117|nr:carotenoid oxygenase family protein [Gordonia sp. (in: high G+C Gram-positive bacteria)]NLG47194.1 carotenoid oxygenase family protein [Gordonia sp. (in: high G+C Gram-positive bacteria)]